MLERDSFDAWGFRRTTDWQTQRPIGSTSIVSRGFTDHEELDSLGLVNMNGRIYDPGIGRFLSADPYVQSPITTQNFNRYSYVVNNPLSLSDPSGFNIFGNFFRWLNNTIGSTGTQILIGVIAVAAILTFQYEVMPALCTVFGITGLSATVVTAAGAGFAGAFTSTLLSGASLGQALEAGLITGAAAALTAGVIGPMLEGIKTPGPLGFLERCTAHGIAGGVLNGVSAKLENGSFRDGFLAGFASEAASPAIGLVPGNSQLAIAERTVLSAAVGGTAAELGGGKFANGAVTAAFLRLYNEEQTPYRAGIGIEVPKKEAVGENGLDVAIDTGHTFAYVKDMDGNITGVFSFGPGRTISGKWDAIVFQNGNLPGNANWKLSGTAEIQEYSITGAQYDKLLSMIQALKLKTPNYTPGYNCTSAAVKLLQGAGISVPNGVGKVNYNGGHVQYQANPWSLHLQLNATTTVPVSVFP